MSADVLLAHIHGVKRTGAVAHSQTRITKRLPAYGRGLLETRRRGLVPPGPYIFVCLDGWNWFKGFSRVVVPPDLDPRNTDFRFVAGLDVVLRYDPEITMPERVDATVLELLPCLPTSLRTLVVGDPVCEFAYVKSRALGIELEKYR